LIVPDSIKSWFLLESISHSRVKAGEEAIRTSASSEALNYYQDGLKLYLQFNKDAKNPEKLAMFEKNIAIALYNKARWAEAVEHVDKVFEYWNINPSPNRMLLLINFAKNAISITTGLNSLSIKRKPFPSQMDNEIFELFEIKNISVVYFDNIRFVFSTLNGFNRGLKFNLTKSPYGPTSFSGICVMFAFSGLLLKFSNKLLAIGKNLIDRKNIKNLITYAMVDTVVKHCSGDWTDIGSFDETLVDDGLKAGEVNYVLNYIWFLSLVKTEKGDLYETELSIAKQYNMAKTYDYYQATIYASCLKTDLMLKRVRLPETIVEAERGNDFSRKYGAELQQLMFLGYRAEASILLNDIDKTEESIRQADEIIDKNKFINTVFIASYFIAQFVIDIQILKKAMASKSNSSLSVLQKKAYKSGKTVLRKLRKYAPYRTKTFRLMGEYFQLIDKQKIALKWWDKAIKKGEQLGARPDLSRTYFQISKSLLAPESKYKEWNGIKAQEYLKKAKNMFEEMDLQYDLDELDKVMASQ